ncbi:peptidase A1 family protein [Abortiporus biennis]
MFLQLSFTLLLVSLQVLASPSPLHVRDKSPVTLPFARRLNTTGTANLLKIDQARALALKNHANVKPQPKSKFQTAASAAFGLPSDNQAVEYTVEIGVGNPPVNYTVLVDTGSSNTWICCEVGKYAYSETSIDTGNSVYIEYGSGVMTGEQYLDQLTLAPGFVIRNQSLGVALVAPGFEDVDGILGLGPQDLTCNTLFPDDTTCVPTVTDNSLNQGLIDSKLVGISFEPTDTMDPVTNGEISFGNIDTTKFTGKLSYVPITETFPATEYVGIDQNITYGSGENAKVVMETTSGITDTGTTLLLLASDAIANYTAATGAVLDSDVGLLKITPAQFSNLQSLFFTIGDEQYEFTPNAQIWPRSLNSAIGGTSDAIYLIIADIGYSSGNGLDFINGMTFLERFYTVYDSENEVFGIATTKFTSALTN